MKNREFKKKVSLFNLTAKPKRRLVHLFTLFIWVLFHYFLGNKPYSLYLIVFFIPLILYSHRIFTLLVVSVLILVLFNMKTMDTLFALKQLNLITIENPQPVLTNIFSPNSVPEADLTDDMQTRIRNMVSLIKKNAITSYQLSYKLYSDSQLFMRITIAAWPIKMENTSPYIFATMDEIADYSTCSRIESKKDVILVYCH